MRANECNYTYIQNEIVHAGRWCYSMNVSVSVSVGVSVSVSVRVSVTTF